MCRESGYGATTSRAQRLRTSWNAAVHFLADLDGPLRSCLRCDRPSARLCTTLGRWWELLRLMRILFVNYEYPPLGGGGGVATRDIAVELAKRHEVDVLTSAAPDLAPAEAQDGVTIYRAPVLGRTRRSTASILSMVSFWSIGIRYWRRIMDIRCYEVVR